MIRLVGIREAAKQLSVSADTVRRKIRRGEVKAVRIGRRVLVPIAELEKLCSGALAAGVAGRIRE